MKKALLDKWPDHRDYTRLPAAERQALLLSLLDAERTIRLQTRQD